MKYEKQIRFMACLLGLAMMSINPDIAYSQSFPSKPIRIVVPFPPAGGQDIMARAISQKLSEQLRQSVVVDNRPGGGTVIGTDIVAKARPDGYTVLMASSSFAINPVMRQKLPYDTLRDFIPISQIAYYPYLIVSTKNSRATSVKELIAVAKKAPGRINYAASATGPYLAFELFKQVADIDVVVIPFKGAGPALTSLLGGDIDYMVGSLSGSLPFVRDGKLRAMAVTGSKRVTVLPDVPTVAEAGFQRFEAGGWNGVIAPSGTSDSIINKLHRELSQSLMDATVAAAIKADGAEISVGTPGELSKLINEEIQKWRGVLAKTKPLAF